MVSHHLSRIPFSHYRYISPVYIIHFAIASMNIFFSSLLSLRFLKYSLHIYIMNTIRILFIFTVLVLSGCTGNNPEENFSMESPPIDITPIVAFGKSLDWSHTTNMIALGKMGEDFYYDVYIMNPDGSDLTCLTDSADCPQKHNGNPVWHPSGDYIVFTAENEDVQGAAYDQVAIPGRGVNCNLWAVNTTGSKAWQLTAYDTSYINPKGVLHPQMSHDGTHLLWAERLSNCEGTPWGEWVLKVADFIIDEHGPHLEHIKSYQPGESHRFYESHAFSPDDKKILFCGNLEKNQLESGIDICEMDISTESLVKLTDSFSDWDEHAHYSPDGSKIAWMSSTGLDIHISFQDLKTHQWPHKLRTELWIMDADGSYKQQITHFNEHGHPHYRGGEVIVSDSTWSPDGTSIAVTIAIKKDHGEEGFRSHIILITFQEAYTIQLKEIVPSMRSSYTAQLLEKSAGVFLREIHGGNYHLNFYNI